MKISIFIFLFSLSLQLDYDQNAVEWKKGYEISYKICLQKKDETERSNCIKTEKYDCLNTCFY